MAMLFIFYSFVIFFCGIHQMETIEGVLKDTLLAILLLLLNLCVKYTFLLSL